ncbi:hypothetical protein EZV62_028092 [Acer yangbiense]|uniref:RNase H type-1 domain-containing protein n=1 Tax=Acer yangbiense TaxID=1000413 RepID=A0A5C7GPC6_9ROSI|nr:hypothetical protein EZV62_028092 [Acer yangbiense]
MVPSSIWGFDLKDYKSGPDGAVRWRRLERRSGGCQDVVVGPIVFDVQAADEWRISECSRFDGAKQSDDVHKVESSCVKLKQGGFWTRNRWKKSKKWKYFQRVRLYCRRLPNSPHMSPSLAYGNGLVPAVLESDALSLVNTICLKVVPHTESLIKFHMENQTDMQLLLGGFPTRLTCRLGLCLIKQSLIKISDGESNRYVAAAGLAYGNGLVPAVLESDALSLVNTICLKVVPHTEVGVVVQDILNLLLNVNVASISFVPRIANKVAHGLAEFALDHACVSVWLDDCPLSVESLVLGDIPNIL